ncbi:MAG: hypothetical protein NZ839_04965, partial [Endomicrobia bacterium]|nr:hypothetical protein [Endomicrobiia bacterium]
IDTEENIIEILPDIDSLPQEIPQLSDFSKVKAIYNIIARSQRTIKKMLIKILSEKDIYLSNFFKNEFVSQLKQVGFNITDTLPADYCLEVDIATEYLGDKITLPDGTQKSFAEQFSGSVNIKLKDMNTNNILLSKSFVGIKGFGRTKKEAEEVTLKKMAGIVAEYVDKNFSK